MTTLILTTALVTTGTATAEGRNRNPVRSTAQQQATARFMQIAWAVHTYPFLVCTRAHESSPTPPYHDTGAAPRHGYGAINPNGRYFGAYQFHQTTWDNTARHAGAHFLVGQRPDRVHMFLQDVMALHLFRWMGKGPWGGRC